MAKLRTQAGLSRADYLSVQERAALGNYRAGGYDREHYLQEYGILRRAWCLPELRITYNEAGEVRCEVLAKETDKPNPATPPRVFSRLAELVELIQAIPAPTVQLALL